MQSHIISIDRLTLSIAISVAMCTLVFGPAGIILGVILGVIYCVYEQARHTYRHLSYKQKYIGDFLLAHALCGSVCGANIFGWAGALVGFASGVVYGIVISTEN